MKLIACLIAAAALLVAQEPADRSGWMQASRDRAVVLPADHASHPGYKVEWWYYTGNLDSPDHRRFGYQLTFFRVGVNRSPQTQSRWAVRDLFMAHFALTDVASGKYMFAEKLNRAGPGWAGAATDRYHVWNEDWAASLESPGSHQLVAAGQGFAIDLAAREDRPAVLHGRNGYSQKGADPANASHYYSLTRMPTTGRITVDGKQFAVSGSSWMDHEFGTSFLEPNQRGWDWMALQLDDGRGVMLYRLRDANGAADPHSSGTVVERDGQSSGLSSSDFTLEPGRAWTSSASGARYPVGWRVRIPSADADLSVTAVLDDQELRTKQSTNVTYWEGAVDIAGRMHGHDVKGRGYLEMTGYAGGPLGRMFESGR